jgi:hypothetical protein
MSKYYELSEDTVKTFHEVFNKKTFPLAIRFQFVGCESQKQLIKIAKMPEHFEFLMEKELLIMMNEDLFRVFDEESITILIEQELDKVSINIDNGKIKLIKPDLTTFSGIVSKYGIEKVARANQVEELYNQQKKDGQEEEFII